MAADIYIQELSMTLQQYPDVKYKSRLINTLEIAQQYKKRNDQINITDEIDSKVNSFEIPAISVL
ncbi:28696_t:CDS:2 [Racocetra persica]|uniref:28696_t:CDS:1 n=1 Tax=Racocetra persica TaxID=160502 RepID=A0ACA9PSW0_9GLOM|nr:28696_t:CDS:2 [Racocetra persica]